MRIQKNKIKDKKNGLKFSPQLFKFVNVMNDLFFLVYK